MSCNYRTSNDGIVMFCRVRTAKEAILTGIATLRAGNPQAAIELFQKALELPGNGAMRFAGTVREYR
jgi:riboflavin biosynthesis pyrimidine reductase